MVVRGNAEAFVQIRPWHHFDVLDRVWARLCWTLSVFHHGCVYLTHLPSSRMDSPQPPLNQLPPYGAV